MLIQSWDPGARKGAENCGLALIDASKIIAFDEPSDDLIEVSSIDGRSLAAIGRAVKQAKQLGAVIVVERQFPTGRSGANPMDLEHIIIVRGRLLTVAEMCGVEVVQYFPATWQSRAFKFVPKLPELCKVSKKTGKPIRDTKKSAAWLVDRLYPGRCANKDEADAAVMGRVAASSKRSNRT